MVSFYSARVILGLDPRIFAAEMAYSFVFYTYIFAIDPRVKPEYDTEGCEDDTEGCEDDTEEDDTEGCEDDTEEDDTEKGVF